MRLLKLDGVVRDRVKLLVISLVPLILSRHAVLRLDFFFVIHRLHLVHVFESLEEFRVVLEFFFGNAKQFSHIHFFAVVAINHLEECLGSDSVIFRRIILLALILRHLLLVLYELRRGLLLAKTKYFLHL